MARTAVALLALAAAGASAQITSTGVFKSTITEISPQWGSIKGGTKVTIKGTNLMGGGLDSTTLVQFGNTLCDVEEYDSSDSQVVCFTRPQHQDGSGTVTVTVSNIASGVNQESTCRTSCTFRYDSGYGTPYVYHASDAVAAEDTFAFNGHLRATALPDFSLRFDNATCDFDEDAYAAVAGLEDPPVLDENNGAFPGRAAWSQAWWMCVAPNTPGGRRAVHLRVDTPTYGGGTPSNSARLGHVDWATDEPYDVTVVPVVASTSWTASGSNGGSEVTVSGTGFDPEDASRNEVTLAGAPCAVTAATAESITCTAGAAPAGFDGTTPVVTGTRGLTSSLYPNSDFTGTPEVTTQVDALVGAHTRSLVYDRHSSRESYSQRWEGFFVPPMTGDYAFTAFSDDGSSISLSPDADPANAVPVAVSNGWNGSLALQQNRAARLGASPAPVSAWQSLTAGTPYWFSAQHQEGSHSDFFYGGLRVRNAIPDAGANALARERRSLPETWSIAMSTAVVRERHEITVLGLKEASTFRFKRASATSFPEDSAAITGAASTGTVSRQLRYALPCGSVSVSKTAIAGTPAGADETPAQVAARLATVGWKWTITLNCPAQSDNGAAFPDLQVVSPVPVTASEAVGSGAAFASSTSVNWVRLNGPSLPLSGQWTLTHGGTVSAPIEHDASSSTVEDAIRHVYGWSGPEDDSIVSVASSGNGDDERSYLVTIRRPAGNIAAPTVGAGGLAGASAAMSFETVWDGDASTYEYFAAPMDFFRTALNRDSNGDSTVTPVGPVEVTVNGVAAACDTHAYDEDADASCTFRYDSALTPTVATVAPTTGVAGDVLTVTGTGFSAVAGGNTVTIGDADCAVTAESATSITCTLGDGGAGAHAVTVLVAGGHGLATSAATFTTQQVIASVTPATGSVAGGTLLTITGSGFLGAADAVYLTAGAASSDPAEACAVQSATHTSITCRTPSGPGFVARRLRTGRALAATPVNVLVNTAAAASQFTFDSAVTPAITGLTPAALSTAITGQITIETNIAPGTAVSVTVGDRECVDQTTAAGAAGLDITCWLRRGPGGAETLLAPKVLVGPNVGFADHAGHKLDTAFQVDSISVTQGSLLGGAEVTVTGKGFANRANTNEALLVVTGTGWSAQRGRFDSEIVSYSDTSVVFRVPPLVVPDHAPVAELPDGSVDFVDAALTMRVNRIEAACNVGGGAGCTWRWAAASTGSCSGADQSGDPRAVTVAGAGLAGAVVTVDGAPCAVTANTAAAVTCDLPARPLGDYGVMVRTAAGYADCADAVVTYATAFDSVTPDTASLAGGALVTVAGWGFEEDSSRNAVSFSGTTAQVVASTPNALTVRVPFRAAAGGTTVSVTTRAADGSAVQTASSAADAFTFTASTAAIASVAAATPGAPAGDVITLTGVGLGTAAGTVSFGGADCAVTAWAATSITCTLTHPVGGTFPPNVLLPGNVGRAAVDPAATSLEVALTVSAVSAGPVGLGGGAEITVTGSGFPAATAAPAWTAAGTTATAACADQPAVVTVCGQPAEVTASSPTTLTVAAPSLATPAAVQALGGWEEAALTDETTAVLGNNLGASAGAYDTDIGVPVDAGHNDGCFLGVDLGDSAAGLVTRVRWYSTWRRFDAPQGGHFQGSTDGATWVDIAEVEGRPTEGWNVINVVGPGGIFPEGHDLSTLPAYRYLRFYAAVGSGASCALNEIQWIGYPVNTAAAAGSCPVTVATAPGCGDVLSWSLNLAPAATAAAPAGQTVAVSTAATPTVTGITPDNASSLGGTSITITGTGFGTAAGDVAVTLNGVACPVDTVSASTVTCTTAARPTGVFSPPAIHVHVAGKGAAVVDPVLLFRYLDRWSSVTTWRFQEIPSPGDLVTVPPGQALLLDTPVDVFMLLVQGAVVWDTTQAGLTLDATYILVHGGRFELGREDAPMQNTATITLHGDRYANLELPRVGAKCLAVMDRAGTDTTNGAAVTRSAQGFLDVHGPQYRRAWTLLARDAHVAAGSNEFELAEPVDWPVGSTVVLPSTTRSYTQAEEVVLDAQLSPTRYRIRGTFRYEHRADVFPAEVYGHSDMDMRGEVGLLTRKVVIQGDENSEGQAFGVHTIAMGGGTYRISHTEVRQCGQSFLLGRYCTHGHLAGEFSRSYVQSNSIHHSFQRITTIHGVKHFLVKHNFGYHVKGHSIFVEDGIEEFNVIEENLVAVTLKCTACLKSDIKPASFWTASPRQFWRHNRAAGCTNDGYWLELPGNPHGPSFTTTVCPVHEKLGGFFNNTAHSNGVHGLRLYPVVLPYENPCANRPNPFAIRFYNFTSFRNGNHGIFGKKNGDLHHINAKLGFNGGADQFWTKYRDVKYHEDDPNIYRGLFVGSMTPPAPGFDLGRPALWAPQDEFFHVKDTTFVNYGDTAAMHGCAKCDDQTSLKQGGYTVRTQALSWYNSNKRVAWTAPYKQIFYDLDGTLTGLGPQTWVSAPWAFNAQAAGCSVGTAATHSEGVLCDATVEVRRIQIDQYAPEDLRGFGMLVAPRDDGDITITLTDQEDEVPFRYKELAGWVFPLVTRRWVHFRINRIIDWETLQIRYSEPDYVGTHSLNPAGADEWVGLSNNWISHRWRNKVHYGKNAEDYFEASMGSPNQTEIRALGGIDEFPEQPSRYPLPTDLFGTGYIPRATTDDGETDVSGKTWFGMFNNVVNETAGQPWDADVARFATHRVFMRNIQCRPLALPGDIDYCAAPGASAIVDFKSWSDPDTWAHMNEEWGVAANRVPQAGDLVIVPETMAVILDVPATPILAQLEVFGRLEFDPTQEVTLNVKNMLVQAPTVSPDLKGLYIGTPDAPRVRPAAIRFHGIRPDRALIVDNSQFLDNKVLGIYANVSVHGAPVPTPWTRLSATAAAGATSISLADKVAWQVGWEIVVAPTSNDVDATETVAITAIDNSGAGSVVTFAPALAHEHLGVTETVDGSAVPMHAAVGVLTRSIKFEAVIDPAYDEVSEVDDDRNRFPAQYGFHLQVGEFARDNPNAGTLDDTQLQYVGAVDISNVQFVGGGPAGMQHAAIGLHYRAGRDPNSDDLIDNVSTERPVNAIRNCAFQNTWNRVLRVEGDVPGIVFEDNVVAGAHDSAVFFAKAGSDGARINRNLIAGVRREMDEPEQSWVYPFAGIYMFGRPASMSGNVVAGSEDQGITFRPEMCAAGADRSAAGAVITGNEVVGAVIGFWLIGAHVGERVHCQRLVDALAWRNAHMGIFTLDQTSHILLDSVTVADSHIGVSLNYFRSGRSSYSWMQNSVIVATTAAGGSCGACRAATQADPTAQGCNSVASGQHRVGILVPQYTNRGKTCFSDVTSTLPAEACWPPTLPERLCNLPWEQRHGLMSTRHQELVLDGVKLLNFKADSCGAVDAAIKLNPTQSEAAVPITIERASWAGTDEAAQVDLGFEANTDGKCSARGCDSFQYMTVTDLDGSSFDASGRPSMVIRRASYTLGHVCDSKPLWGDALLCYGDTMVDTRAFVSESLDRDRGFRRLEPISMMRPEEGVDTGALWGHLGPLDDNCAKRFYFGQEHGVAAPADGVVTMNVTGTLPGRWRMHWFDTDPAHSFVLGLHIRRPFAMSVYVGTRRVEALTTVGRLPTTADPVGTNVYVPQSLTLWITMRGSPTFEPITVVRSTEVQLDLTLAMSVDEFYGSNIVNNLAILLNVNPDQIQTVDVQAASAKASLLLLPASGQTLAGAPASEPDSRAGSNGTLFGADLASCQYDANNTVVPGSCGSTDGTPYDDLVDELWDMVDIIVANMEAGTMSAALGAEVLAIDVNAPPRQEQVASGPEDEAGVLSLRERQDSADDSGLNALAIGLITAACVVAVVAVVGGLVMYRRTHGAHVRGVVRGAKHGRRRVKVTAEGSSRKLEMSALSPRSNPMGEANRFKRGSMGAVVTGGGAARAKRGSAVANRVASPGSATKVASTPTRVRGFLQFNHRGERMDMA